MNKAAIIAVLAIIAVGAFLYFYPLTKETTDLAERAQAYCVEENVAAVEISRSAGYIKVVSSLLGGGSTYYPENGGQPLECPVVGPDAMSAECRAVLDITDWETICEPGAARQPTDEEAELVGFGFIQDFIALAPGALENPQAVASAYAALSTSARAAISEDSLVNDLAQFVGVQDVPDQGASVEDLQVISDNQAILVVGLNYSGSGRVLRNVHLVVENGEWKVDRISTTAERMLFDQTGNLIRNNPGLEPDVWYLSYEQVGQPGLTVMLQFEPSSVCAEGDVNSTCDPDALEQGQRVHILGEWVDVEAVRVIRLENR